MIGLVGLEEETAENLKITCQLALGLSLFPLKRGHVSSHMAATLYKVGRETSPETDNAGYLILHCKPQNYEKINVA